MKTVKAITLIESLGVPYFRELSTFGALSDKAITDLLSQGDIRQLEKGEVLYRRDTEVTGFSIVIQGNLAHYKHCVGHDVLTRHFRTGEQMCFDTMIGLRPHAGTAIAIEQSLILEINSGLFFDFHIDHSDDFGLLMINLARELSREISMLENVIGESTGWSKTTDPPNLEEPN